MAALVSHGGWRQQLAEQRWGLTAQRQVTDWLAAGIRQLAVQVGWQQVDWQATPAFSRSDVSTTSLRLKAATNRASPL